MLRQPVVSGQFYPGTEKELKSLIEKFSPPKPTKSSCKGLILPHAGYIYSGKVAVQTVSQVLPKKRIIILGPNHTGFGAEFALWDKGAWSIPFGQIQIDEELTDSILKKGNSIQPDHLAHKFEHSIEVELPILYHFFQDFKFVPIACQQASLETYRKVAVQIYEAIKGMKEEVLLVASSDMTHYEPDATARKKDRIAIDKIINLDEEGLLREVRKENITMCGTAPAAIMLSCLKSLGARKAQVALYQTSGDSSGDYSSVVGYAGIVIA
ncbi:MAG: AmmeMemoRadiSam system protein B [Candidatus Omnitrophota bacterium]|nr:MAG: AmmeMemoRadiSam system protein B [Candidatus Omnitrophota bacterium]